MTWFDLSRLFVIHQKILTGRDMEGHVSECDIAVLPANETILLIKYPATCGSGFVFPWGMMVQIGILKKNFRALRCSRSTVRASDPRDD
jgi:hypothetical protein